MRIFFNGTPKLQRKIAWLLLFSVLALFFVAWLILANRRNIEKTAFWINHTYDVIALIEQIDTRIPELESDTHLQKKNFTASGKTERSHFYEELNRDLIHL